MRPQAWSTSLNSAVRCILTVETSRSFSLRIEYKVVERFDQRVPRFSLGDKAGRNTVALGNPYLGLTVVEGVNTTLGKIHWLE